MEVLFPVGLDDALAIKGQRPDAVPMAGGTDLLVHWPQALAAHDRTYLDLWGLDELRGIRAGDEGLELGALATYWDLIRHSGVGNGYPLLPAAAREVGAVQIQARGTWAGNVANASPAADGVPVLMACDASVVVASAGERREIRLDELYTGYKELALAAEELIVAIRVPPGGHEVARWVKVGSRRAQAITKVGLALTFAPDRGWRVVANSLAPTVCRCRTLEALLDAERWPAAPEDLLEPLRADVSPIDDVRSSARYRERVMTRILFHALQEEGRVAS